MYATTGNTLDASCQSNKATHCGISDWNGCVSACKQKRDILVCNSDHSCTFVMGSESQNCASGAVCTGIACLPVSNTNYCHYSEDCDFGDCVAETWYTSCGVSGQCRPPADKTGALVVPVDADPGFVLNDNCVVVEMPGSCE